MKPAAQILALLLAPGKRLSQLLHDRNGGDGVLARLRPQPKQPATYKMQNGSEIVVGGESKLRSSELPPEEWR